MTTDKVQRIGPTPSTVKKLFAYSGNQCAVPNCKEFLVDHSGAMLGKIAHIHAAEKGGPRFNADMTNDQRRAFENLLLVCGKHHDIIDYQPNVKTYTAEELRKYKAEHEGRFKRAERHLLEQVNDTTQATQPTYPKTLAKLGTVTNDQQVIDHDDDVSGVRAFIEKLKELPLAQREFAVQLATRMMRNGVERLLFEDVKGAFQIGVTKIKEHMRVLEHHGLGGINEGHNHNEYFLELWERKPWGNPWFEMIEFCEATGLSVDSFVYDLNFAQYDE